MEIKIPKEVRAHKETIFFGLTARQFFCAVLAVALAVGVYFLLKSTAGQETATAPRVFRAENIYRRAMNGKGGHDDA